VAGFCEGCDEEEFLDRLHNYQQLKEQSSMMEYSLIEKHRYTSGWNFEGERVKFGVGFQAIQLVYLCSNSVRHH
jgi:hypothetical protein